MKCCANISGSSANSPWPPRAVHGHTQASRTVPPACFSGVIESNGGFQWGTTFELDTVLYIHDAITSYIITQICEFAGRAAQISAYCNEPLVRSMGGSGGVGSEARKVALR